MSRIISFAFGGIIDWPGSQFEIGQPGLSAKACEDYMAWKKGDPYWKSVEKSLRGTLRGGNAASSKDEVRLTDGVLGEQEPDSLTWVKYPAGKTSISVQLPEKQKVENLFVRCLDYAPYGILPPERISVYDEAGRLLGIREYIPSPNNRHDAWIDCIDIPCGPSSTASITLSFDSPNVTMIDEIYVNIEK